MFNNKKEQRHAGTSSTGAILAGFVFFPLGLLSIIFFTIPNIYNSLNVYRWTAQNAELISVELKENIDQETNKVRRYVKAKYSYQWQENTYTSEKVNIVKGSASFNDQSRLIYARLKKAKDEGKPIIAWVNPEAPAEAVINRSFRWGSILVQLFVSLIACLFGFFCLRSIFQSHTAPEGDAPWLANPKWRDNFIHSDARSNIFIYWSIAIFLCLLGVIPITPTGESPVEEIRLIYFFPFNVLTFGALAAAVKASWQWWRYGVSPLTLDPFPGSIGGDVGGEIFFRIPYSQGIKAEVQLTAAQNNESKNGESLDTTLLWQEDGYACTIEKDGHTVLKFRFTVPEGLPHSDISYEKRHYALRHYEWTLNVTVITPQKEIKRTYKIPVYPTAEQTTIIDTDTLQENPFTSSLQAVHQILPAVQHQGEATLLKFPMRGITVGMRLMLWLGSVLFITALLILINSSFRETMGIAGIIIVIAALYLLGRIIYHHFNALQVQFTGNIVISERQLLGITLRSHFVSYYDINNIVYKLTPHATKGEFHQAEHVVYAVTDKGDVILAERIEGRKKAELVCEHLRKLIKLDERLTPS